MFFLSGLETTDGKRFDGLPAGPCADDLCQGFTDRRARPEYLRRRAEVDAYLWERRQQADDVRQQIDERTDPAGIRERLLSRRAPGTS